MMKKSVLALMLGIFAVISVSAQSRASNFLGAWKLAKIEGDTKKLGILSVDLNVSQAGDEIRIERNSQVVFNKRRFSRSQSDSYKSDGKVSVSLSGGITGGQMHSQLRLLAADKLRFDISFDGDYGDEENREIWSLSDDGKTLTVESYFTRTNNFVPLARLNDVRQGSYWKMIFSRQ
jgi:hypothetical protein